VCFYKVLKPEGGSRGPKHVAEQTLELGCVDCVLDYLLQEKSKLLGLLDPEEEGTTIIRNVAHNKSI
jgi:hypothetical protein